MDYEKLVEQMKWWAEECDRTNFGCQAKKTLQEAANALSMLQAENEKLRTGGNKAPECERCQEIKGERQMYINACEQIKSLQALLQKRNEILQHKDNEIKQLRDELERMKVERDAYQVYFKDLSSKPDCNTCEKRSCEYKPRPGAIVRVNCPLYSGPEKED